MYSTIFQIPQLLFLGLLTNSVASGQFNFEGFAHCVINLVDSDARESGQGQSWVEKLSVSNLENPRTITRLPVYESELSDVRLTSPNATLVEKCSVNVLIQVTGHFRRQVKDIFGSRLYGPGNTLIFILGDQFVSKLGTFINQHALPLYSAVFMFEVPNTEVQVTCIHSVCPACSKKFQYTVVFRSNLTRITISLRELRQIADQIKYMSTEPLLGTLVLKEETARTLSSNPWYRCMYHYKQNDRNEIVVNECTSSNMLFQSAATYLNWSIIYMTSKSAYQNDFYLKRYPRHIRAIAFLYALGWKVVGAPHAPGKIMSHNYDLFQPSKFVYCTRSPVREAFTFMFWAYPLDSWSWILLGVSIFALIAQVRGEWLEIFAILMRQSCSLFKKRKILILFSLAVIVFTNGYEGIISSLLTVPPPYKIFSNSEELLEAGYRIAVESYVVGEIKENAALPQNQSTWSILSLDSIEEFFRTLALCNTTTVIDPGMFYSTTKAVKGFLPPGAMCYLVTGTVYPVHLVHTFIGEDHERISSINRKLFETGFSNLYSNNEMYIYQYQDRMSVERMDHLEARKDVPFIMTDWKMLSIFIVWISLMGISAMLLGFEKCIKIIFDYKLRFWRLIPELYWKFFEWVEQRPYLTFSGSEKQKSWISYSIATLLRFPVRCLMCFKCVSKL